MEQGNERELVPLNDADLEIAEGEPDVRGWPVIAADGERIGEVDELLVDAQAMEVRYLDVDVDEKSLGLGDSGRHLLVRVGQARLDEDEKRVYVDDVASWRLRRLHGRMPLDTLRPGGRPPADDRAPGIALTSASDEHDELERGGPREDTQRGEDVREMRVPRVEEELAVERRPREAGAVHIHKTADTEHVTRDVETRRDDVDVRRVPADAIDAGAAPEGEIRIPIVEEEIVVQKRPVVREVLVLRKRTVTETREVEADVRKERIAVESEGRVDVEKEDRG